jgi:hypothetical protein
MRAIFLCVLFTATLGFGGTLEPETEQFLRSRVRPKDSVSLVLELAVSGQRTQWLVTLSRSKKELQSGEKSSTGIVAAFQSTLHCSTGRDYRFEDKPFAVDIEMAGPFGVQGPGGRPRLNVTRDRAIGNQNYFFEGLYPTAEVYEGVLKRGQPIPALAFLFRGKFTAEQIARDQAKAAAAGISISDEKEIARSAFALNQFGVIAGKVEAFRDVLGTVIELPTLLHGMYINVGWDGLRRSTISPEGDDTVVWQAPLTLQTRTRLKGRIRFVRPVGPLRFCAGLVDASFDESQKAPDTVLHVWVCEADHSGVTTGPIREPVFADLARNAGDSELPGAISNAP